MQLVEMIQWVKEHPAEVAAILGAVALVARAVVKYNPNPTPGTLIYYVVEVCKFLGTVIPNSPNDPVIKKAAEQAAGKAVDSKVMEVAAATAAVDQINGAAGEDSLAGRFGRLMSRRRTMRLHVRRTAKRHGIDVSDWDDETVDEVIDRADARAREMSAGPLRDLLEWMIANPEEVLAIIKILVTIFAGEPKARARK